MAKQIGDIIIKGTLEGITFYIMDGKGYARKKSSLTGKRVKKDPRFRRTMESAGWMAMASRLASVVYRSLAKAERVKGLFKELVSLAVLSLKEGMDEAGVVNALELRVGKVKEPVAAIFLKQTCRSTIKPRWVFDKRLFTVPDGGKNKQRVVQKTSTGMFRKEIGFGRLPKILNDG